MLFTDVRFSSENVKFSNPFKNKQTIFFLIKFMVAKLSTYGKLSDWCLNWKATNVITSRTSPYFASTHVSSQSEEFLNWWKFSKHKFLIIKRDVVHQITSNAIIFIGCKLCIKSSNIRSEVEKSLMPITWWWVLQPEVTEIFISEFIFLSKKLIRICFLIYSRLKSSFGRPESFLL